MLVNNVGTNRRRVALDSTAEDFAFLMHTNVQSALHLSQLCHPLLAKTTDSSIIINSSVAGGPQAMKSGCMYAMTKGESHALTHYAASRPPCMVTTNRHVADLSRVAAASLNQLTKNLACEWARDGIRVNAVAPWYTATPAAAAALEGAPEFEAVVLARTPLGRIGQPEEVAGALPAPLRPRALLCLVLCKAASAPGLEYTGAGRELLSGTGQYT